MFYLNKRIINLNDKLSILWVCEDCCEDVLSKDCVQFSFVIISRIKLFFKAVVHKYIMKNKNTKVRKRQIPTAVCSPLLTFLFKKNGPDVPKSSWLLFRGCFILQRICWFFYLLLSLPITSTGANSRIRSYNGKPVLSVSRTSIFQAEIEP